MGELTAFQIKRKRMAYLACSTFSLLFLGLIYAFSMFAAPMCQTFGLAKADIGLTFNIMMIAFCVGAIIGSKMESLIGLRPTIILSGVMFFAGFAGTSLFATGQILAVYLLYGVLGGLGVGIGYNSIIATTNIWFPDKVGFSSGVLMMGFGLGSLVLGTLSLRLVPLFGLESVFIGIGIATVAVTAVLSMVLHRPPDDIMAIMAPEKAHADGKDPADGDNILTSPTFYLYCAWAVIVIAIGLATIGNCSSDAQMAGFDAAFASLLVGLVSTCNGLARVIIGMVYDKTNVKTTMLVDSLIAVCATVCVVGAFTTGTAALYAVGALCCGFCYGGVPVVASAFVRQRFGSKKYPFNFSVANFAIVFGSLLNIVVQAAAGGQEQRMTVFFIMMILSLAATIDVIPFSKRWNRDMGRLGKGPTA